MIDAYASLPHYAAHLRPIWQSLPDGRRGAFYGDRRFVPDVAGLGPRPTRHEPRVTLVASYADSRKCRGWGRPVIYVEHGAGQSYSGDPTSATNPSYSGGSGHDGTVLFLGPSEAVVERWRRAYPGIPARAVGCPRLDALRGSTGRSQAIVLTWHWDCRLVPETRTALPVYDAAVADLADACRARAVRLLGHAHPRNRTARAVYQRCGIEQVADLDAAIGEAGLLVADNTSALYEAAAVGVPVVAVNAPYYRRDVHHGLRFWDLVPGPQIDEPDEFVDGVLSAYADPGGWAQVRADVTRRVYAVSDGSATARAVAAIVEVTDARGETTQDLGHRPV